jgi:hypothetical protein
MRTASLGGPGDYVHERTLAWFGPERGEHLEQDVADAIVRYERTG